MRIRTRRRLRAIGSWASAGTLTLLLSGTALALTAHHSPSVPATQQLAAHDATTTSTPGAPPSTEAPVTTPSANAPVIPTTMTITYAGGGYGDDQGGDDSWSGAAAGGTSSSPNPGAPSYSEGSSSGDN